MELLPTQDQLSAFLCKAKISTYASFESSTSVKPLLPGSHQLDYRQGSFFYRDIYYGGDYFVGVETVYYQSLPLWGMSYAGGINEDVDPEQTPEIYDFLKAALREVPIDAPYRGPETFSIGDFKYYNRYLGNPYRFTGVETISHEDTHIFKLHYSGGLIKD